MTQPTETAPPLAPLTDDEITALARDIVTNLVYISNRPEAIQNSFMIMMLASPDQIPPNIGAVYEYYAKAGPLAVNGMPTFFSAKFVPAESMEALWDAIQRMRVALGLEPFPEAPEAAERQNEGHGEHEPGADVPDGH